MNASTLRLAALFGGAVLVTACGKGDQPPAASSGTAAATPLQGTDQPAPAVPATFTAPAGAFLDIAANDTLSSTSAKAGDAFTATVVANVADRRGNVVIPQGATVRGTVTQVASGSLTLAVSGVTIRGRKYPLGARIDSLETIRRSRKIGGKDVAKVGIGAAAGALLGRVIGGNAKGAVIGGVVGAAAGTGVAAKTHGSDVVLPKGAHINLTLTAPLEVQAG